ncbi:hypothetical protein BJX61DRAFT_262518 [Aspergillus egyptiacus]|nr:hypothetical protein BJX61DRAFT_262518 [Aspergillus egyptiacus]
MGRRAYLNRLALGRSPYEAPELPAGSSAGQQHSTVRRISPVHADGYVQHYDERGHPVNPESKSFGRELRRAKNDILSTMGIVVSEDANRGRNEQQKIDAIVAENDYGLVMVTIDQISVFLGSWWTTSLTGRIQTFRSYAHVPLTRIIAYERASIGAIGFYFGGIPAWAASTCISICRHHPLERLISAIQNRFPNDDMASKIVRASFTILHSASRGFLLLLAMQTYVYSLLQSLHLVHPVSFPGLAYFMPLGEFSSMLLPPSPADLSFRSLGSFALNLLKTPSLFYIYVYLRPLIEVRLYRLIRRRLPKPIHTDDLSIKVALDNDLIDWMVPSLGRRAAEETQRSHLPLIDDMLFEVHALRKWLSSRFTWKRRAYHDSDDMTETVPDSEHPRVQSVDSRPRSEQQSQSHRDAQPDLTNSPTPVHRSGTNSDGDDNGNEENQLPTEDNVDLLRRARNLTLSTRASFPDPEGHQHEGTATTESRRQSQSDTLLSRSSSPASSQSSPHLRAQVIQEPDIIAMQLELESRHPHTRVQGNGTAENEAEHQDPNENSSGRRSISELLDTLLSNQNQSMATILNSDATDTDDPSSMTAAVTPQSGGTTTAISPPATRLHNTVENQRRIESAIETNTSDPVNILPDLVEEPPLDDPTHQQTQPHTDQFSDSDVNNNATSSVFPAIPPEPVMHPSHPRFTTGNNPTHRVTILSALPLDSLASHLAAMITSAVFAPLESFYLRSLASSYLDSRGASAGLRSDVYSPGAWGGGRSRPDVFAYMGKVALMMGVQAAVNASVWGLISGSAIRIGRRWCGWGSL